MTRLRPRSIRIGRALRELAVVAMNDVEGLSGLLERHSGRPAHVEAAQLLPDAPSGVCLRTAEADHLYYEEQTSPFHQAHILVGMAAHLLSESSRAASDFRVVPDVSSRLSAMILGEPAGRPVSPERAEAMTFRAMSRAGATECPLSLAKWFLRQLSPLHLALLEAVPEAAARPCGIGHPDPRLRLYRQVIEIRDAMLALRPYQDPRVVRAAEAAGGRAGLKTEALAAAVEATVLAAAVAAKQAGSPGPDQAGDPWQPAVLSAELRGEAGWLAKVSRAYARPLVLDGSKAIVLLNGSPHAGALLRGRRPVTGRSIACLDGHLSPRDARKSRRREERRSRS